MIKKHYVRVGCPECPENYNRGERVEWRVGYEKTGEPSQRNNRPAERGGDVLGWQVKSPKASITGKDACDGYIFGFADEDFYYEMTIKEFEDFLTEFSYMDRDSKSGKQKIRIKGESSKMHKWLMDRT